MRWSAGFLFCVLACGDDARGPSDAGTCDPLATRTLPITIGNVVAAGTAPDGVTYVVTRDGADTRVFVSEGDTFVRRRVTGSGFSLGASDFVDDTVGFEDTQPSRLVFQSDDDYAVRMALVHDDQRTYYDALTNKIELTIQPDSIVAGRPARNLPGDVLLQYAATTPDGQQLLVTRPEDDWTAKDYRLFLGRGDALQEIPITIAAVNAFARFEFVLNGMPGSVVIGNPQLSPSTPSVLQHDNGEWALTLLPTGSGIPDGWRVYCL
ncbi:MAG TPA: hypothetical protein VFX59_19320 [Polyangiales bacterium]|nr:hypothetical protein [Polyangiales bacterium]